jgi:hypothetical protein
MLETARLIVPARMLSPLLVVVCSVKRNLEVCPIRPRASSADSIRPAYNYGSHRSVSAANLAWSLRFS